MMSLDESMVGELDDSMRRQIRRSVIASERSSVHRAHEIDIGRIARAVAAAHAKERARKRRVFAVGSMSLVGVAAAAAAMVFVLPSNDSGAVALSGAPRCASMSRPAAQGSLAAGERFSLDSRARISLGPDSAATFTTTSACSTTIALERGTVDVWAKDLAGGELRVESGDVAVLVHGTIFRVTRGANATSVEVDEGLVEVRPSTRASTMVHAGRAVDVIGAAAHPRELDPAERARVHAIREEVVAFVNGGDSTDGSNVAAELVTTGSVTPPVNPQLEPRPTTAAELLAAAETAYREGRTDEARQLFHQAGALRGADAEAAWLRLGRLEERAGRSADAAAALEEHRRRFPRGRLAAEALFLEARERRVLGQEALAVSLESRLLDEYPSSPQAARVRTMRAVAP